MFIQTIFKCHQKNIQSQVSFIPNLRILLLHQTLQLDKLVVADFKYDHSFSKMLTQTPKVIYSKSFFKFTQIIGILNTTFFFGFN